jgi:DNA polymerase (family X)
MSRRFTLQYGRACAEKLLPWLTPYCDRLEIAGSLRRQRRDLGDIDLVAIPKLEMERDLLGAPLTPKNLCAHAIRARCLEKAWPMVKWGPQYLVFEADGVQVDLWFATAETFGSVLMCRTGSKEHNIWLAQLAADRGGHWNPHHGLRLPGHRTVFAREEHEIYAALGRPFLEPTLRDGRLPR